MPEGILLDCLRQAAVRLGLAPRDPAGDRAGRAVEHVVARAIPGLREVRGYVPRLREPVAGTLAYLDSLINELGEPLRLDRFAWLSTPYIPLLFTTVELARDFFAQCEEIRKVFRESDAAECYFLMAMRRSERTFLGYRLYGDIPRKDELQCSVTFEEHQVVAATASYERLREELALLALDHLARIIPERLERSASLRVALLHAKNLLKAQADALRRQQREEEPGSPNHAALKEKIAAIEDELAANAAELAGLDAAPEDSAALLRQVRDILLHPGEHVTVQPATLVVDEFGIKARSPDQPGARRINFFESAEGNTERFALLCARVGRETAEWIWPELRAEAGSGAGPD